MNGSIIFEFKNKIQEIYAEHSIIFDKGIQFLLALVTYYMINKNIGFMSAAASPVATLALAVISAFFPMIVTVFIATGLILIHMYSVSIAFLVVTALIFLVMYVFYFRLTPKMALVVLLTPMAFVLKIPFVILLAYALISTPVAMIAIACGTIVYYMLEYVKMSASGLSESGISALMSQVPVFVKQIFQNKEMWAVIVAYLLSFLIIYTIRRQRANHAWKIAIGIGALLNIGFGIAADSALGISTSYTTLIAGSIAAVVIGIVLEILFFSVDYTKCENLQYEDDEYYYFVKAVPKLSVSKPEKTVKRITGNQETEIMDTSAVRDRGRKAEKRQRREAGERAQSRPRRTSRERKLENMDAALSRRKRQ